METLSSIILSDLNDYISIWNSTENAPFQVLTESNVAGDSVLQHMTATMEFT